MITTVTQCNRVQHTHTRSQSHQEHRGLTPRQTNCNETSSIATTERWREEQSERKKKDGAGRMFKGYVVALKGEFTTGGRATHNSGPLKCLAMRGDPSAQHALMSWRDFHTPCRTCCCCDTLTKQGDVVIVRASAGDVCIGVCVCVCVCDGMERVDLPVDVCNVRRCMSNPYKRSVVVESMLCACVCVSAAQTVGIIGLTAPTVKGAAESTGVRS